MSPEGLLLKSSWSGCRQQVAPTSLWRRNRKLVKASSRWGGPAGEMASPAPTRPISSPQSARLDNIPGRGACPAPTLAHTLRVPRKGSAAQSREQGGLRGLRAFPTRLPLQGPGASLWELFSASLSRPWSSTASLTRLPPGCTAQGHLLLGHSRNCPEGCAGYKLQTQGMAEPHPLCKPLLPS